MFQNIRNNKSKYCKEEVNKNIYKLGHHMIPKKTQEVKKDPYDALKEKITTVR